jgi:hypothetical protein
MAPRAPYQPCIYFLLLANPKQTIGVSITLKQFTQEKKEKLQFGDHLELEPTVKERYY